MSFKKIQLIDPNTIGCPESGHIYFGRDDKGLWEKYSDCGVNYITTGSTSGSGTNGTSGSSGRDGVDGINLGTSGTSGKNGTSGVSGTSGTSGKEGTSGTNGSSGSSGITGTSGSSGIGTSGSSGLTGSSGTSGLTGTAGSSGVDGNFYGSSGTSGFSGGYGGAARKWISTYSSGPSNNCFYGTSSLGGYNFTSLTQIVINKTDADNQPLQYWLRTWLKGILKIERRDDLTNFGIYLIDTTPIEVGNIFTINISGGNCIGGNGAIIDNNEYLISFIETTSFSTGLIESIKFEFNNIITGQTYILDLKASYNYLINEVTLQSDTGTGQTDFYISTTGITSLTGITFNNDIQTYTATGSNSVISGNSVNFIITNLLSNPNLIRGVLKITRV